jgi:hypothetical protein
MYLFFNKELRYILTQSTRAPTMCRDAVDASHHDGRSHDHHCHGVSGKRLRKCRDSGVQRVIPNHRRAPLRRPPPGGGSAGGRAFPPARHNVASPIDVVERWFPRLYPSLRYRSASFAVFARQKQRSPRSLADPSRRAGSRKNAPRRTRGARKHDRPQPAAPPTEFHAPAAGRSEGSARHRASAAARLVRGGQGPLNRP